MKWCIQKFDGNWRYGSSGRAHALQAQRPEFKIQSQQKKKKKKSWTSQSRKKPGRFLPIVVQVTLV
jgi:hypothetical protein